jgi:hypothetical protein
MSPGFSPDPTVHWATIRQLALQAEYAVLDGLLGAYVRIAGHGSPFPLRLPQPLLGHFPMLETDDCGCDLCADWSLRRDELRRAEPFVPDGHRYHTCDCRGCAFVKRFWLNLKAAENRRDLLIGASFHAYHNSGYGLQVMDWFVAEILQPERTTNWWALEGGRYPLSRWLRRCEMQLGPVVSGSVFEGIEL